MHAVNDDSPKENQETEQFFDSDNAGKGITMIKDLETITSFKKPCDRKILCIIILSILLLVSIIIIIVLSATLSSHHHHDSDSGSSKPSYYTSSDPRFGDLILDEEFDTFNLSRWKHVITMSGGGNWEFEYYTNNRSNSYVRDGILYIKPTLTNDTFTATDFLTSGTINLWGSVPSDVCTSNAYYGCSRTGSSTNPLNPVQSARIRTVDSFSFKYGRVEIRAQLPSGDWIWPAIWMLPKDNSYGQWPASGEIDIIESRGNDRLVSGGYDMGAIQAGTTIHWGPYYGADMYELTTAKYTLPNLELYSEGYHNWTLDWTPDGINCSVDGDLYFNVETNTGYWNKGEFETTRPGSFNPWQYGDTDAPFDQEMSFIINVAVGGTNGYFPTGSLSEPTGRTAYTQPWNTSSSTAFRDFWNSVDEWYPTWNPFENNGESAALKVDYIRVYEYISS